LLARTAVVGMGVELGLSKDNNVRGFGRVGEGSCYQIEVAHEAHDVKCHYMDEAQVRDGCVVGCGILPRGVSSFGSLRPRLWRGLGWWAPPCLLECGLWGTAGFLCLLGLGLNCGDLFTTRLPCGGFVSANFWFCALCRLLGELCRALEGGGVRPGPGLLWAPGGGKLLWR